MENEIKKEKPSISTPAAIVTAGIIIALALVFTNKQVTSNEIAVDKNTLDYQDVKINEAVLDIKEGEHINGDLKKAEVAIIEYSDSDCPFCQRFHQTMKQIRSEYADKVVWVYRHFPLTSLHPNALNEAIALECVSDLGGNEAFWKYMEVLINNTYEVTDKISLEREATTAGVNSFMFNKCVKDESITKKVAQNVEEGRSIGAQGTPFSIAINLKTKQKVEIPGAYPLQEVRNFIDSILK